MFGFDAFVVLWCCGRVLKVLLCKNVGIRGLGVVGGAGDVGAGRRAVVMEELWRRQASSLVSLSGLEEIGFDVRFSSLGIASGQTWTPCQTSVIAVPDSCAYSLGCVVGGRAAV